jgi:hypothetical protein
MRSWRNSAHLTRGRVSQMLLLTNLAPAIQEELLFLPKVVSGPERITEEQLRSIAKVIDWDEQIQMFRSLWHASSPMNKVQLAIPAPARLGALTHSSMPSNGTHVVRFSGTTALSVPASAECAR